MTPLLGRPVMEHIIGLLKDHGINDICVTLCYKPQTVMDHFGDGQRLGVQLTYFVEDEPLGTAGSVKNCMARLGREDFLVISGDCVCDLDLSQAVRFHQEREAAATLALYRHETPLEYGLVLTDGQGRVERFVEKPGWGQVFTDQINTGIYVLSPAAMDRVPQGEVFDFGKDLFPALLQAGAPLYGLPLEGYWCDMGDCGAYLACACDALSGKVKLDMGLPKRESGVWSAQPVPDGVTVIPPCWIGEGVNLGRNSLIGPHAVLDREAQVGERAMVQRSILLERSSAGPQSTLYGSILCPGATARKGATLNEGTVLGENALAEEGTVLLERVKLWPGQAAPAGGRLARSITSGSQKGVLRFGDSGTIRGVLGEDMGPEALLTFEKEHPGARVLLMEENFRSNAKIVEAADRFIQKNVLRHEKHMRAWRPAGADIRQIDLKGRGAQYKYLLKVAEDCRKQTAVLYRDNESVLPLVDLLERRGIPYRIRNAELAFFTHRVVLDIRNIILFAENPKDTDLFLQIYYKLSTYISKENAVRICDISKGKDIEVFEAVRFCGDVPQKVRENCRTIRAGLKKSAEGNRRKRRST